MMISSPTATIKFTRGSTEYIVDFRDGKVLRVARSVSIFDSSAPQPVSPELQSVVDEANQIRSFIAGAPPEFIG